MQITVRKAPVFMLMFAKTCCTYLLLHCYMQSERGHAEATVLQLCVY
jgi:hypothetical protein